MKKELIKFMEEQEVLGYRLDGASEQIVRESIDQFFDQYQPERSKREDLPKWASRAVMMPDGLCHFEDGTIIDSQQPIDEGCGALNSSES